MNMIWLSSNEFGYELLKEVFKLGIKVRSIITLADTATTVIYDAVDSRKWYEFGVPVYHVDNINSDYAKNILSAVSADMMVVCGWRQLISEDVLKMFNGNVYGFHPTLLPVGRGPSSIINTIMYDFKKSGVSFFKIVKGLDDGDIIGQVSYDIDPDEDSVSLYRKMVYGGKKLVWKYFPLLGCDMIKLHPQFENDALIFEKFPLEENRIDLSKDSLEYAYRKIRALAKYKGAYIEKDGKKLIIRKAELVV